MVVMVKIRRNGNQRRKKGRETANPNPMIIIPVADVQTSRNISKTISMASHIDASPPQSSSSAASA